MEILEQPFTLDSDEYSTLFACNNEDDTTTKTPEACFTFTYEGDEIWLSYLVFTNCSENATSYHWDFGDNTYSTQENPIHSYSEDGEYIVELTAYNDNASDTFSDTILVNWTAID